jgi:hypothetical protein
LIFVGLRKPLHLIYIGKHEFCGELIRMASWNQSNDFLGQDSDVVIA